MGKNLKGKECGKGICQRKDGQYYARFVNRSGKRQDGYFATLPEARNWLEDARYQDKHGKVLTSPDMTVTEWFQFWQAELLQGLSPIPSAITGIALNSTSNPSLVICGWSM